MELPCQDARHPEADRRDPASPGWKTASAVLALYAAILAVATYPMVVSIRTSLPSNVDPVQHLTIMRWYKTCLLEGRSPFLYSEIQHPIGAPIGSFSPMLLQTTAYLALSSAISNDVLCYNLLWFSGFLLTGMGTFLLARRAVGDTACAGFAGVAAMLSGPMMLHAHGHLELIYVGWFPLFLVAWMRFVDRPRPRSMAVAAAAYGLMTLSAGYFAVLAVIPAGWYLAFEAIGAARREDWAWIRPRGLGLLGFGLLAMPFLLLAFSGQLWNVAHGLSMNRSRVDFEHYGVPWYGYAVPTVLHQLDRLFGVEVYDAWGHPGVECASYLGVATLGLILYAAIRRVGPKQPAFWWSVTLILVVLSFGASAKFGSVKVPLPASWLYQHVFAFRMLRAPARFNLFAAVGASILAASGLKHLISRWRAPSVRWGICGTLTMVAVLDLSMIPFSTETLAELPQCYGRLVEGDPAATFLDAPLHNSANAHPLTAASGYWQSFHRGRTTGGYSGVANPAFDNRLVYNTPFSSEAMARPEYLLNPDAMTFGIVSDVRFLDYAWLYLTAHDLRYVVLHRAGLFDVEPPANRARLEGQLGRARIFADDATTVFDRTLLPSPGRPVLACAGGWRGGSPGRSILIAPKVAEVLAYNPDPDRELTFTLGAKSFREPRTVRLRSGATDLATWQVRPDVAGTFQSPPFRLPAGLQTLAIESDGETKPRHRHEILAGGDDRPYSLSVSEVSLRTVGPMRALAGPEPKGPEDRTVRR